MLALRYFQMSTRYQQSGDRIKFSTTCHSPDRIGPVFSKDAGEDSKHRGIFLRSFEIFTASAYDIDLMFLGSQNRQPSKTADSYNLLGMVFELRQNVILPVTACKIEDLLFQVILAGTLTGVQGDIRCKALTALSTVKIT